MKKKQENQELTVEQKRQVDTFVNSSRYSHIQKTKKIAIKHGLCQEQLDGKCMYPHCGCLFEEKLSENSAKTEKKSLTNDGKILS